MNWVWEAECHHEPNFTTRRPVSSMFPKTLRRKVCQIYTPTGNTFQKVRWSMRHLAWWLPRVSVSQPTTAEEMSAVPPTNGILFSHWREWDADTHCNTGGSWKCAVWNKLVTKNHTLCDSIYVKYPYHLSSKTEGRLVTPRNLAGWGCERRCGWEKVGRKRVWGGLLLRGKSVLNFMVVTDAHTCD